MNSAKVAKKPGKGRRVGNVHYLHVESLSFTEPGLIRSESSDYYGSGCYELKKIETMQTETHIDDSRACYASASTSAVGKDRAGVLAVEELRLRLAAIVQEHFKMSLDQFAEGLKRGKFDRSSAEIRDLTVWLDCIPRFSARRDQE